MCSYALESHLPMIIIHVWSHDQVHTGIFSFLRSYHTNLMWTLTDWKKGEN